MSYRFLKTLARGFKHLFWDTQTPNCLERRKWHNDPLAHPAIRAMTERERADLPFSSHVFHDEE
ncbi:hypothetical protein [Epibacterium ulvae]|uniref:hypothetical protein n=1 Tax=Epibacterium ulvae TaxID=1156985 RepID=UPI002492DAAB|nr:hypothetical protein [Epibacterium ulvae]